MGFLLSVYRRMKILTCGQVWVFMFFSMFREISHLTQNELEEIFTNLLEVEVKNLEPEQMPPVVYQILLLTNEHPSFIGRFLSLLANYYNTHITPDEIEDSEDIVGM